MNPPSSVAVPRRPRLRFRAASPALILAAVAGPALFPSTASASFFHGETLDKIADVIAWIVLIVVPGALLAAFWMVHILPEKIAEKKKHPQAKAIQCLCLLSLVFGGLLWPLAWLWTYTKPTLHKMAYGTDVDEDAGHGHQKSGGAQPKARDAKSQDKPQEKGA